ncbi:hypothetical protein EG329_009523 [Mollisiaceae sp. DMI_Dod_QoI]|nr:hypothetical protein EG329_009523 [Helotiales sp. DMI_Dod_QoI]
MATSLDIQFLLLQDVLPAYVAVANCLAPNKATAAAGIRRGDLESSTYCTNLHYELVRLQGLLPNFIGSQSQSRALQNVLDVFEKRLVRTKLPIRISSGAKSEYEALRAFQKSLVGSKGPPYNGKQYEAVLGLNSRVPMNRKQILGKIEACNLSLETTDRPSTIVFPTITSKGTRLSSTGSKSPFAKLPELANLAHELLRLEMPQNSNPFPLKEARFELAFSTSKPDQPWQEGEIQVNTTKEIAEHEPTTASPVRRPKSLRFNEPERSSTPARMETKRKVEHICQEIRTVVEGRVRFLVCTEDLWVLRPSRLQIHKLKHGNFITLHDLIESNTFKHLMQKEKHKLSYLIADSILHLYSGRWLETAWNKQYICFLASPGADWDIDVKVPYLSAQFVDPTTCGHDFYLIHPDQTILSLGIVLLEIATGIPLESYREGEQHPNRDLAAAEEMLKKLRATTSTYIPDHILAIETCLQPDQIFERYKSVDDIRWCLYENIVRPLRRIIEGSEPVGGKEGPIPKPDRQKMDRVDTIDDQPDLSQIEGTAAAGHKMSAVKCVPFKATSTAPKEISSGASEGFRPAFGFHLAEAIADNSRGSDQWLQSMKRDMHPRLSRDQQVQIMAQKRGAGERIRIAILDTGYDETASFFHHRPHRIRIKGYRSWLDKDPSAQDKSLPAPQDCSGHGTHATALLLSIADRADIYVARIANSSEELSSATLNIAQAIEHVVQKWDVDIVSMSFGFSHDVPEIREAISEAVHYKKGHLLLFAAASNSGGNLRLSFPASHPLVTPIRATSHDGHFPSYNPPPEKDEAICFGTLGENVLSAWPPSLYDAEEDEMYQSGTSVACPIAAGIAAFILEYIRCEHGRYTQEEGLPDFDVIWDKLRRKKGMEIMFEQQESR